ncbi:MAG: hypothetical protein ACKVTZ_06630 [Bacteroidia bacterium]
MYFPFASYQTKQKPILHRVFPSIQQFVHLKTTQSIPYQMPNKLYFLMYNLCFL